MKLLSTENKAVAMLIGLLWAGVIARRLIGNEPIHWRVLTGELLLSAVFGVGLHAMGVLQGLDGYQLIVLGAFASLGGGRTLDVVMRLVTQLKGGGR